MPIRSNDPREDAQDFYNSMIRDLIEDIPLPDGRFQPRLNFKELVKRVLDRPKAAQIMTQLLHQTKGKSDSDQQQIDLHGTWIMAALIKAFGVEDSSIQMTRMMAPRYYEAARTLLSHVK
jgi:hypothetical protein